VTNSLRENQERLQLALAAGVVGTWDWHIAEDRVFADERFAKLYGVDPALAFTAAYMQFFNYFLVEKLFGGNTHLGMEDEQALNYLTKIFSYGVLSEAKIAQFKKGSFERATRAQKT